MSKRLSRAQREAIIIDYLNKKETPGYEVKENSNGKFLVKALPQPKIETPPPQPKIEIEEEDINEEPSLEENGLEEVKYEQPLIQPKRSKQNAKELLRQLQQLLVEQDEAEDDEEELPPQQQQGQFIEKRYNPGPQNWKRRRLVL